MREGSGVHSLSTIWNLGANILTQPYIIQNLDITTHRLRSSLIIGAFKFSVKERKKNNYNLAEITSYHLNSIHF